MGQIAEGILLMYLILSNYILQFGSVFPENVRTYAHVLTKTPAASITLRVFIMGEENNVSLFFCCRFCASLHGNDNTFLESETFSTCDCTKLHPLGYCHFEKSLMMLHVKPLFVRWPLSLQPASNTFHTSCIGMDIGYKWLYQRTDFKHLSTSVRFLTCLALTSFLAITLTETYVCSKHLTALPWCT